MELRIQRVCLSVLRVAYDIAKGCVVSDEMLRDVHTTKLRRFADIQWISQGGVSHGATCDVHHVGDVGVQEKFACPATSPTALTYHVHRHRPPERLDILGHPAEWNGDGTGHVSLEIFVELTDVNDDSTQFDYMNLILS